VLLKTYPDLNPVQIGEEHIPKIYGFTVFGMRGSKFEYTYDLEGNCTNQKEIDRVLRKMREGKKKPQ